MGRASARRAPTDCAVATICGAGAGVLQQGIPHATGTLHWQHWQQTQWQESESTTGCTRTKAAQRTTRMTQAMRFMG